VFLNDPIRDCHAETRAGWKIRSEGLKEPPLIGFIHALSVVCEENLVEPVLTLGGHTHHSA
jgi:hypothetical protein